MIGDVSKAEHIYIACGYTDMRKSIDGLSALVQQRFGADPFSNSLFLPQVPLPPTNRCALGASVVFCGRRSERIKALYWEGDGFVLLYKRLERGAFQWPRGESEARDITWQQLRWLLEGLSIEQPKAHHPVNGLKIS